MKRSRIAMLMDFLLVIPATLIFGLRLTGRAYYLTSTLIIIELLVPFFWRLRVGSPRPESWWCWRCCPLWQWQPGW